MNLMVLVLVYLGQAFSCMPTACPLPEALGIFLQPVPACPLHEALGIFLQLFLPVSPVLYHEPVSPGTQGYC